MNNSISVVHPELVCEWSNNNLPITPDAVPYGSNKLYWWKGKCGHEWQTSPKARSSGERCPICSGARVVEGINDLKSIRPDLAKEWSKKNILKPTEVSIGSHQKVLWHGKCGHTWEAVVKNRVLGAGCPYCSHNIVLSGFNDLASRFPEIASEWDYEKNYPLTPDKVTAFKNKKVWWRCKEGHEWHTLISTRAGGSQCPYCSGIKILPGFNDLATKYPDIATEWSKKNLPLSPSMVNENSSRNVWWKCNTCGYEWQAVIKARVNGSICPVCSNRKVKSGINDLATSDPEQVSQWNYKLNKRKPSEMSRNSLEVVWWNCQFGHTYRMKIADKVIDNNPCPVCEAEYRSVFLKLAVGYYANKYGVKAKVNDENLIGIPIEMTIPELQLAFDPVADSKTDKSYQNVKKHICKKQGITYITVDMKRERLQLLDRIKYSFQEKNIYLRTDTKSDEEIIFQKFHIIKGTFH